MPTIRAQGRTLTCHPGENLRRVLLREGVDLYNGTARQINCRGIGTCGTCAVALQGERSDRNWKETGRLSLPPHHLHNNRRLACQIRVHDDLDLTKYDGFWGQGDRPLWTPEA
ncbi:2Fe-2S iron-sulfur cluster-binding protein [Lyngbya confervoides]|uniref:(2Fe-2S)-binding protein n=1 Tax=Lyngbya confervoides BDU141951 TaxID=1574623 RepID=A0ABD4T045_9CYAN|nr:2Fe-2S iron-sulfur cluster-binding protein [Lyngbya confervoides]MCM1981893.1 (2Fe-2S)-binding protein [Lyngbya confervoides BDU141951]